jgi:hypothetical protein
MPSARISGQRGTLEMNREVIPVHYMSDIDPSWTHTDKAGHRHHCEYDAPDHYPTLILVTDCTYWCESCHDEHDDSHLECRQCGEEIRPGMTGPGVRYIAGLVTYTLDGQEISEERARELIAEWRTDG